jgi:molybdopterin/thiamine biosynthesis adenylyltransferase
MSKVEALRSLLHEFNTDVDVEAHSRRFTSAEDSNHIADTVLISTDTMASRLDIATAMNNTKIKLVLDTRLAFNYAELYAFNPNKFIDYMAWRDTIKNDLEIPDGPCNLRLCTTLVQIVGSTAVQYSCVPHAVWRGAKAIRGVPFKTLYLLSDQLVVKCIYQINPEEKE